MGKMQCRCGELLSSSPPNDMRLLVYSSDEWDSVLSAAAENRKPPRPQYDVWKCPKCGRIYVLGSGYGPPLRVYAIEE